VSDLVLLLPELVLVATALALIVIARHVTRPPSAAICVVIATAGALFCGWVFSAGGGAGFGNTVAGDGYARFFKLLFASTAALAALLSVRTVETEHVPPAEYYALLLLSTAGMMLAASALDLLILYLGLELMTLCGYILVGITRERLASNEAAIKYFLLGSFASAVLLYGIALIYGVTGATDFAGIAASGGATPSALRLVGIALVAGGLAFKIAAVPMHAWAPDVYHGASAPVAGFLAAGSKAAGLAALVRICLVAFAPEQRIWSDLLVALAAMSMVVGSLLAIAQTNVKRLLAYSSIAHAGYALLGLIPGTPEGASATMTYAFVYAFMTLGAFGVVIALGERGETLDGYRGLDETAPRTAGVMFLFLLSLTGIPLTAGFTAKFAVILSAVRAGYVPLAVLAVGCSVVSAFFYLRIAVLMFMTPSERAAPARFPAAVSTAIVVAAILTIAGGLLPDAFTRWTVPPLMPATASNLDTKPASPKPGGTVPQPVGLKPAGSEGR
jgi:NADH-quinone oxidoreductase subunit N